jgi:uroporphyrinogen decarboxylase
MPHKAQIKENNLTTPRELVYQTLEFRNPKRVPRDLWSLPWADMNYPGELSEIQESFPSDFTGSPGYQKEQAPTKGDAYRVGTYIDAWGCHFENKANGIIGEVKEAIVPAEDEDWKDTSRVHFPEEWLAIDRDRINKFCAETDKFVSAGACPRPFEQLQFIRVTEQLFMDLMLQPRGFKDFLKKMHHFYCRQLEAWAKTDVDTLNFMDDWGTQNSLLINPTLWVELFKPLYKDYIDIAKGAGKKIFMHSDGYTLAIIPHLIELGLDALNTQIFCMGVDKLAPFKGKITFWGEIDRQHLLPYGSTDDIRNAVTSVKNTLWDKGGCIAQCEFGPGAKPENVRAVFETWDSF